MIKTEDLLTRWAEYIIDYLILMTKETLSQRIQIQKTEKQQQ